jgi:hypothetical protein
VFAFAKVTECSTVCEPVQVDDELDDCFALEVVSAVAFGDPAATEAASVAKSAATADKIATVSPDETADLEVIESLV